MDKYCPECGSPLCGGEKFCGNCGTPLNNTAVPQAGLPYNPAIQTRNDSPEQSVPFRQQIIIKQESRNNGSGCGAGCAGFTFALLAIFSSFIPLVQVFSPIFAGLGAVLSFIGLFFRPRGLAIAGLLLSFSGLIIAVVAVGSLAALFASM